MCLSIIYNKLIYTKTIVSYFMMNTNSLTMDCSSSSSSSKTPLQKLFDGCTASLVMFKIPGCVNCSKLYDILHDLESKNNTGVVCKFDVIDLSDTVDIVEEDEYDTVIEELCQISGGKRTFPKLFLNREYVGDYIDVKRNLDFDGLRDLRSRLGLYDDMYCDF